MNAQQRFNALSMLHTLRADIVDDVARRDGLPLTGQNVAVALGEICAQVDALARVLIAILEDA